VTESELKSVYHAAIVAGTSHICCPDCGKTVQRRSFRNHCRNVHGANISSGPGRIAGISTKRKAKKAKKQQVIVPVESTPSWVISPDEFMDLTVAVLYCDDETMPIRHLPHISKFRTHVEELLVALK
jgi:hypothetical protein